jgi:polysaccharide export outer membrane protein
VSVYGEVRAAGSYVIESGSTVLDVIARAGGISDKGSDVVYLVRADEAGVQHRTRVDTRRIMMDLGGASSAPIQTLRGGDSIVVPKSTFLINGQVAAPGEYRIESDMVLFQALARAGGVTRMGSASRVEIRRRGPDDKFVDIKGKKETRIEPGDIITVKERLF